jgi:hypothetical protein
MALSEGRERVAALLSDEPISVTAIQDGEEVEYEICSVDDLDDQQVGYSVTAHGQLLIDEHGGWRERWLVIGSEELTGDPVFVDLGDYELPVLTAMHGAGTWEPRKLATSLASFLRREPETRT